MSLRARVGDVVVVVVVAAAVSNLIPKLVRTWLRGQPGSGHFWRYLMARRGDTRTSRTFDPDFLTPLAEPKAGANVGPDVFNIPEFAPGDPLGYCIGSGGNRTGSIKGDK